MAAVPLCREMLILAQRQHEHAGVDREVVGISVWRGDTHTSGLLPAGAEFLQDGEGHSRLQGRGGSSLSWQFQGR